MTRLVRHLIERLIMAFHTKPPAAAAAAPRTGMWDTWPDVPVAVGGGVSLEWDPGSPAFTEYSATDPAPFLFGSTGLAHELAPTTDGIAHVHVVLYLDASALAADATGLLRVQSQAGGVGPALYQQIVIPAGNASFEPTMDVSIPVTPDELFSVRLQVSGSPAGVSLVGWEMYAALA